MWATLCGQGSAPTRASRNKRSLYWKGKWHETPSSSCQCFTLHWSIYNVPSCLKMNHNDKESMSTGMASLHGTIKKVLWPIMKNQTRQPEVCLIAYRMSEKWVTCGRTDLYVWVTENNGIHTCHRTHRDCDCLSADGLALGAGSSGGLV